MNDTPLPNGGNAIADPPGRSGLATYGCYAATLILLVLTLATRLPAPWRTDVINDEMLHLESWRNRYDSDNPLPVLRLRLENNRKLPPALSERLLDWHRQSRLFQWIVFAQCDCSSPVLGMAAEVSRVVTDSSLVAQRLPAMLASLAAVLVGYLMGVRLRDRATGLCIAAMFALSPAVQVYAGLAKHHSLALLGLALFFYAIVLARTGNASLRKVLLFALLGQLTHYAAWLVIGPLLAAEIVFRYLEHRSLTSLLRQIWWYVLISLVLLGVFAVQAVTVPSTGGHLGWMDPQQIWSYFCVVSPFSHLSRMHTWLLFASGTVTLVLSAIGVAGTLRKRETRALGWMLLVVLVSVGVTANVSCPGLRHMLIYAAPFFVAAGIGLRSLFRRESAACLALAGILVVFTPLSVFYPEDPYRYVLHSETPFSEFAEVLKARMQEEDRWIAYPHYLGNCLYRYGPLPDPIPTLTGPPSYKKAVADRSPDHALFVFTLSHRPEKDLGGQSYERVRDCPYGRYVLLKFPPTNEGKQRPSG